MKEVMCQIIHHVTENSATVDGRPKMPVEGEERVRQLPERRRKDQKESRRHDQTILIHRQVVMNAMEQEVHCKANPVVGKITVVRDFSTELPKSTRERRGNVLVKVK